MVAQCCLAKKSTTLIPVVLWGISNVKTAAIVYLAAAEPATCKTSCVPLSSFTVRPAEVITEP